MIIPCRPHRRENGFRGNIDFQSTPRGGSNAETSTTFDILEDGRSVLIKSRRRLCLEGLPVDLHTDIIQYVCNSDSPVVFDLDNKTVFGSVSRSMRTIAQYNRPWNRTQFILKMTAHSSTTDFDHFNALECWTGIKTFRQIVYSHHSQAPTVLFNLELGETVPWKDIRINVKHLLHLLEGLDDRSRLDIRQHDLIMDRTSHDEGCTSWASLQIDLFMLLSDIFRYEPSRGLQPLPDLWINGEGQICTFRTRPPQTWTHCTNSTTSTPI
jgi:hypothetical protein